jgi:hypothetical protein
MTVLLGGRSAGSAMPIMATARRQSILRTVENATKIVEAFCNFQYGGEHLYFILRMLSGMTFGPLPAISGYRST